MSSELPGEFRGAVFEGSGRSAVVYRCVDRDGGPVAVKLFSVPLDDPAGGGEEFRAECRTASDLSVHSGVIGVYAAGVTAQGRPWLSMEYAAGGTLAKLIERDGPLPADRALALMAAVADTVAWAHSLRSPVVHGDLKPSNILLDGEGQPKLGDFGVAKRLGSRHSVTVAQLTQAYAAPEVLSEGRASVDADVWSLAATLFEMVTGAAPFIQQPNEGLLPFIMRVKQGLPDDAIPARVPAPVADVIRRGLTVDRSARPSAMQFAQEIRRAQELLLQSPTPPLPVPTAEPSELRFVGYEEAVRQTTTLPPKTEPPAPAPVPDPAPPRTKRRVAIITGVAVAALLLSSVGAALAFSSGDQPPPQTIEPASTVYLTATPSQATQTPTVESTSQATTEPESASSSTTSGPAAPPAPPANPPAAPALPPITDLSITSSATLRVVNYTVSVNPNGDPVTVRVQSSHGRNETFTTGTGVWSRSFSDEIGYNVTLTITATATDDGRPTQTTSRSQSTGAPPPIDASITNLSVSGPNVTYTVTVNPNGDAATVRVQSNVRNTTYTTGTGTWSQTFTDNIGYNATNNITVTVTDDGRPTVTRTASRSTGAPPPPPRVISLSRGGSAPQGYWYSVTLSGFPPNTTVSLSCHDSVDRNFFTGNVSINGSGQGFDSTLCYSRDGPDHWVTGGGVESNHVTW